MVSMLPDFLFASVMEQQVWIWGLFLILVFGLMAIDLGLLNRKDKVIGASQSLRMAAFYVSVALLFGVWVWFDRGSESAFNYYAAYFVEYSLSLDNIFVMSVIFSYFAIPREYQHRVLFWGILGVLFLRGTLIALGAAVIAHFHWVLLLFGAVLVITGIKLFFTSEEEEYTLDRNRVIHFLHKHLHVSEDIHGHKFFVKIPPHDGHPAVLHATPLFLALACIEVADLIFAFDSIPAVFAITADPYIVFTSNVFAVVGLRTLYFALAAMLHRFHYLRYAVSAVLVFIGCKVFYAHFIDKVHPLLSLSVTIGVLAAGMIFSLVKTAKDDKASTERKEQGGPKR